MPDFLNFADALIHSPKTAILDGAVIEEAIAGGHTFKLIVHQPPQRPLENAPWKVRYELATDHPAGGFAVDGKDLASALRGGFPFSGALLKFNGGAHASIEQPTGFEFTDYLESLTIDGVNIAVFHKVGFDEEFGDAPGFTLAIRKGKERHGYAIDPRVIALAAANSELFFGYALDCAPDAAQKLSAWLTNIPGVRSAYQSDLEQKELRDLLGSGSTPADGKARQKPSL